jgi:hypothetical protein
VNDLINLVIELPENILSLSELAPEILLEWIESLHFVVETFCQLAVEVNLFLSSTFFKDHLALQSVVTHISCQVRALSWEANVDGKVLFFYLALFISHLVWVASALAVAEHVP